MTGLRGKSLSSELKILSSHSRSSIFFAGVLFVTSFSFRRPCCSFVRKRFQGWAMNWEPICLAAIHVLRTIHPVIPEIIFSLIHASARVSLILSISWSIPKTRSSPFCLTLQVLKITKSDSHMLWLREKPDWRSTIWIFSLSAWFIWHPNVCMKYVRFIYIISFLNSCSLSKNARGYKRCF